MSCADLWRGEIAIDRVSSEYPLSIPARQEPQSPPRTINARPAAPISPPGQHQSRDIIQMIVLYDSEVSINFLAGKHKMHVFCMYCSSSGEIAGRPGLNTQHNQFLSIKRFLMPSALAAGAGPGQISTVHYNTLQYRSSHCSCPPRCNVGTPLEYRWLTRVSQH